MTATRWPGGSESDNFHWESDGLGPGACGGGYVNPASTFDNFVKDIVRPANLDLAVTVNYGSNPACTGGADPSEAAGWVAYANGTKHDGVAWWTVGNEEYGSWETDEHSKPHDGGYALMLFNLNKTTSVDVPVKIAGKGSGSGGPIVTYDKAIYDASKHDVWSAPASAKLAAWNGGFTVHLPPWSMAAVRTK